MGYQMLHRPRPPHAAILAAFALAATGGSAGGEPTPDQALAPPPQGRIYHAAFPDFGGAESRVSGARIRDFERLAGRRIAWAYFSNNWFDGEIRFPSRDVRRIHRAGRLPFVRLMARSGFGPRSRSQLLDGVDRQRRVGRRVGGLVREGRRPHPPPAGRVRHRGQRRLVPLERALERRRPHRYYPGDDVVDWIGLSDYGPLKPSEGWESFHSRMDAVIYDLLDHLGDDRPLAVLEYGAADGSGCKARRIRRAIGLVARRRWPEIRAIAYWHEAWRNGGGSRSDLRIDSSPRVTRAYRRAVDRKIFTGRARFGAP
jgi:hypothetical protein